MWMILVDVQSARKKERLEYKMSLLKKSCNICFNKTQEVQCDNEFGVFNASGNEYYPVNSATFDGEKRADSKNADILLSTGETLLNVCLKSVDFIGKCPITYTGKAPKTEPTEKAKEEKGGFFS